MAEACTNGKGDGTAGRSITRWRRMLAVLLRGLQPLLHCNVIPDCVLRYGVRIFLAQGLHGQTNGVYRGGGESAHERKRVFMKEISDMPLAIRTAEANEQHYEVPTMFYDLCLGTRKKYSACLWPDGVHTLEQVCCAGLHAKRCFWQQAL